MLECLPSSCCVGSDILGYEITPSSTVYLRTSANPTDGGATTGDGDYEIGSEATVTATPEVPSIIDVGVDIVFCLDESGQMIDVQDIITEVVTNLESELIAAGIGSGTVLNRYAAVQFGRGVLATVEFPFESHSEFIADIATVAPSPSPDPREDAYDAINYSINEMPWRTDGRIAKLVFFITDEDRNYPMYADGADQSEQFANIKAQIVNSGIIIAGMFNSMNTLLRDVNGDFGMACDYTGRCYLADGLGGYTESTGAVNTGTFSSGDHVPPIPPVMPGGQNEQYWELMMDEEVRGYFYALNSYRADGPIPNTAASILSVIVPSLADRIVQELVWTFVGWYSHGGALLSTDQSYTFTILNNTTLEARFVLESS